MTSSTQTSAKASNQVLLPLVTIITAYSPKLRINLTCPPEEGKTKQEFKDECDINVIMKRYAETGITPENINRREALYMDVTSHDFQTAMDIIADANTAFAELPAHVRDRFNNDPKEMLAFVEDPDNADEANELGLLSPEGSAALAEQAKAAAAEEQEAADALAASRAARTAAESKPAT